MDAGVALLVGGTHWWLQAHDKVNLTLTAVPPGQRTLVYGAVATVAALAAGSNNTAVGSYVSSNGPVIDGLRRDNGRQLRKALRSVGAWLWMVSVAGVACLVIDPVSATHPTRTRGADVVFEAAVLMLVLKFARLTLIQDMILAANDLSAMQKPKTKRTVARKTPNQPSPPKPDA